MPFERYSVENERTMQFRRNTQMYNFGIVFVEGVQGTVPCHFHSPFGIRHSGFLRSTAFVCFPGPAMSFGAFMRDTMGWRVVRGGHSIYCHSHAYAPHINQSQKWLDMIHKWFKQAAVSPPPYESLINQSARLASTRLDSTLCGSDSRSIEAPRTRTWQLHAVNYTSTVNWCLAPPWFCNRRCCLFLNSMGLCGIRGCVFFWDTTKLTWFTDGDNIAQSKL